MTCDQLREEMELHALGLSEDPERSEIQDHLRRGCDNCSVHFKSAIAMNAEVLATVEGASPSSRLRRRVMAGVGSDESNWGWIAGWGFVAAALVVGLVWFSMQDRMHQRELADARRVVRERSADLARMRAALDILNLPETKQVVFGQGQPQPPKGRVFVHQGRGVLLLASNLPQLSQDKTYALWIIPKGGTPRPAGLFQADANGTALYMSEGRLEPDLAAVAVSVEPSAGSPAPTTTPIIVAPLAE